MMNERARDRERLIRRQASSWYWTLQDDLSELDAAEWQRWRAVPEHQQAFKEVSCDWERWRNMPWPERSEERASQSPEIKNAPVVRRQRLSSGAQGAALAVDHVASQEAAYWYFACVDDLSMARAERQEFLAWMQRSPENIAELFKIAKLDGDLRRLNLTAAKLRLVPDDLRPESTAPSNENVRPRCTKKQYGTFSRKLQALAAAVLIVVGAAMLVGDNSNHRMIVTDVDQWERTQLEDGTALNIDARTRLEIDFTSRKRLIRVYEGNVVFDVAKDPRRPFIVRTPLSDATALGTRFGVSVDKGVRTTVSEGIVQITAPDQTAGPIVTLRGGEELFVTDGGFAKHVVLHVDAERKLAWSTGWLEFRGDTIGQAVKEFNRRNSVRIEIGSPRIANARIFGRFRVDSPAKFAAIAAGTGRLVVTKDAAGKVTRLRLEEY